MSEENWLDVLKDIEDDDRIEHQIDVCLKVTKNDHRWYKKEIGIREVCTVCGYLRARIRRREEKFFLRTGRLPSKEDETPVVKKRTEAHIELKRHARNAAATLLQAVVRGGRVRRIVWGAAGAGRFPGKESLNRIRGALAYPKADVSIPPEWKNRKRNPGALKALVERLDAERELAGRTFPTLESGAEELHAEKALVKTILKSHTQALTDSLKRAPTAMDLEPVKPIFVLYHVLSTRIGELGSIMGDMANAKAAEAAMKEQLHDLRAEAKRLKAILSKYEEAFTAQHGRKMKTKEEIAPIATEYTRFKEVKKLLLELQGSL